MTFAKQLVDICLSSLKTSQKTLRYILERGVVSDDMAQPSVALSILQQGYKVRSCSSSLCVWQSGCRLIWNGKHRSWRRLRATTQET